MDIVRVVWTVGDEERVTLLRDPVYRGEFFCGIECNEHGIGIRNEGCSEDAELMILATRIVSTLILRRPDELKPEQVAETDGEPASSLLMYVAAALLVGLLALGLVIVVGVFGG